MSDLITTICYIVLVVCAFGFIWGCYMWYLDWLWGWQDHSYLQKPVERPVWVVCDESDREIARFD